MISSSTSNPNHVFINQHQQIQKSEEKNGHWLARIYRNHSDLISSIGNDVLNTIILVSRVVKQIPHFINRSAYFAFNITGMFWINMQIRDLGKNIHDAFTNTKAYDLEGIITSAAKVTVAALNILLATSLLAAALVSLAGLPQAALTMYAALRPFSLSSFFLSIGGAVYDYKKNQALVKIFDSKPANSNEAKKFIKCFVHQLYNAQSTCQDPEGKRLARHTFKQLDHFQLDAMLQKFRDEYGAGTPLTLLRILNRDESRREKLYKELNNGLNNKNSYTRDHLGLVILGYVCMGICKAYPDSLIQSSVTWGISLLYTLKKIKEKLTNKQWTNSLTS